MENQNNIGEQNNQQIEQNTPGNFADVKEKSKPNYWIFSTIFFAVLFIIVIWILAINLNKVKNDQTQTPNLITEASQNPTIYPTSTPTTVLKLDDFINKELLEENDNYSVYLINPKSGDEIEKIGELIVYSKKDSKVIEIEGIFSIFGATIVIDDDRGEYVLLSTGTSSSRLIIPISLSKKTQAVKEFCAMSGFLFWKDYVIYGNCDTFQNRPWEAGQAASIIALNLKTGQEKIIMKSDLTHQHGPTKISDNTLYYLETFVTKEEDWQSSDNQKTVTKTYDLLSL